MHIPVAIPCTQMFATMISLVPTATCPITLLLDLEVLLRLQTAFTTTMNSPQLSLKKTTQWSAIQTDKKAYNLNLGLPHSFKHSAWPTRPSAKTYFSVILPHR
jgi:hypothetical protein